MNLTDHEVQFLRYYRCADRDGRDGTFHQLWNEHPERDPRDSYCGVMDIDHPTVHAALAALTAAKLLGEVE